jgi:hypothetical protein
MFGLKDILGSTFDVVDSTVSAVVPGMTSEREKRRQHNSRGNRMVEEMRRREAKVKRQMEEREREIIRRQEQREREIIRRQEEQKQVIQNRIEQQNRMMQNRLERQERVMRERIESQNNIFGGFLDKNNEREYMFDGLFSNNRNIDNSFNNIGLDGFNLDNRENHTISAARPAVFAPCAPRRSDASIPSAPRRSDASSLSHSPPFPKAPSVDPSIKDTEAKDDASQCVVCLTNTKIIAFQCGHKHTCATCARELIETDAGCPVCRKEITFAMYIYE